MNLTGGPATIVATAFMVVYMIFGIAHADRVELGTEPGEVKLENDELGVIIWGPPTAITLSVGKSDIWDRRLPPEKKPILTLAKITEMAKAGDDSILGGDPYYEAYNAYDFPCPKPGGQLILQLPFMAEGGIVEATDHKDCVELVCKNGPKQFQVKIFVSAMRNVIVLDCKTSGLAQGDASVRVYRHRDTIVPGGELHPTIGGNLSPTDFEQMAMPRTGHNRDYFWVAQDYQADGTFPEGFTAVLAALIKDGEVEMQSVEGETGLGTPMITPKEGRLSHGITKRFTPINQAQGSASTAVLEPGETFTVYATIATTQDNDEPVKAARRLLRSASKQGTVSLWEEHKAKLTAYEKQPLARAWSADGKLNVSERWSGVPYRVRGDGYYGDVPVCSVDTTKFCVQDSSRWHADFHFNELCATEQCVKRQYDLLDSYFVMIRNLLPMAQANAREVYDCEGAMYSLIHYPMKADSVIHSHLTWEGSIEITALIMKPFWERFLYTWDEAFLRDKAYPVMREGARFFADFVTEDADGVFHVVPTIPPEIRGFTKDFKYNYDSQSSLAMLRYHLRASAEAARLLKQDAEEAARWDYIVDHMADYPTYDTPDGPIFVDVAGAAPVEYNIAVPLTSVFWGDDIGLDSPAEQITLARRTLEHIKTWEPHRFYLTKVRRRLGIWNPDDGLLLENVLQSQTGVLRVFPCVPGDFEGGFENLGAQGAFVVAGEHDETGVLRVGIQSLAGRPCVMANPWMSERAQIKDMTSGETTDIHNKGGYLRFDTKAGHTYEIQRSDKVVAQ